MPDPATITRDAARYIELTARPALTPHEQHERERLELRLYRVPSTTLLRAMLNAWHGRSG